MKDKAGGILLALLAVGLGIIAADLLAGGRIFTRDCCPEDTPEAGS